MDTTIQQVGMPLQPPPSINVSNIGGAPLEGVVTQAFRGMSVGLMVGLIVFFVFRPREPYPRWVLAPYEQPWMLLIVALILLLVFQWDQRVSLLMLLFVLGVGLDVHIFGKNYATHPDDDKPEDKPNQETPTEFPFANLEIEGHTDGLPLASVPLIATDGLRLPIPHYPLYQQTSFPSGSPSPFV